MTSRSLFQWGPPSSVAHILRAKHYLGPTARGVAWHDEFGVLVLAPPTSRRLPRTWFDLTRWCITSTEKNAGSQQWARVHRAIAASFPDVTTVVSYSDPSQGHTGALYRACNWLWAPTWHRLRPPPTGNGTWDGKTIESAKDRWVFLVRPDPQRVQLLLAQDASALKTFPMARYREPGGADFKAWKAATVAGTPPAT